MQPDSPPQVQSSPPRRRTRDADAPSRVDGRLAQRERILDALFTVVSSSGTGGASVTEIAEAAGIARGALHYYFESKDELMEALMRRLGDGYVGRVEAFVDRLERRAADGTLEGTVAGGLARWHFAGEVDEAARLLAVWIDYWGQAPSNERIGAVVFDVQERARAQCARALIIDRPALAVLDDDSRRLWGATILGIVEGGLLQWRIAQKNTRPIDRVTFGDVLAAATTAVVDAIAVPDSASSTEVR